MKSVKPIYFFLGTEAELIKIFPVIIECQKRNILCHIIASGQNDLEKSRILEHLNLNGKMLELSRESDIVKSAAGLLSWFLQTKRKAVATIKNKFGENNLKNAYLVVHGDTVSTMMGAMAGKKLGMQVCHVEAGLRSHNLFNPFPEEIDRLITSKIARIHFAPGNEAEQNLKKAKGKVINTQQNTLLDSLNFSKEIPIKSNIIGILDKKYFVFVMHRQENLAKRSFVCDVVKEIVKVAENYKCVIILHKITENAFIKFDLMNDLKSNHNIILQPRVDYFDFMKLLQRASFVITDGGSNQEELFYMNKPCLIMRKKTERNEGIGKNARLFSGKASDIRTFVKSVEKNKAGEGESLKGHPTRIIVDTLMEQNDLYNL